MPRRVLLIPLLAVLVCPIWARELDGKWFLKQEGQTANPLTVSAGVGRGQVSLPGSWAFFKHGKREQKNKLGLRKTDTWISVDVRVRAKSKVKANVFLQTKDGVWFQSRNELALIPGDWQTLKVTIGSQPDGLKPFGHTAEWSEYMRSSILLAGINVYGRSRDEVTVDVRNLIAGGTKEEKPVAVYQWTMPSTAAIFTKLESRFFLTRDYDNPFDPDAVEVNFRVELPNGTGESWPAFFTQDFSRFLENDTERLIPHGSAYWALRYTPRVVGKHRIRIEVIDRSGVDPVHVHSPWQRVQVNPSGRKGFIRVSKQDRRYFEHSTGELFFPVAMNIHSPRDLRGEKRLKVEPIKSRGTYSYDDYFNAMHKNGLNTAEIWMCAWSNGIEWTSKWNRFHGMGRYSLSNAWSVDHILDQAQSLGIYIHLVLDNHGKLAGGRGGVDSEWETSPFNRYQQYASADGGFLTDPTHFFTDSRAIKYNRQRNRYIAARWGHHTGIFGIELWSELELINDHKKLYSRGTTVNWHQKEATFLHSIDQGKHLLSTHFSGDYKNWLKYPRYASINNLHYLPMDGYRGKGTITQLMDSATRELKYHKKPLLTTEYGGNWDAASHAQLEADLHAGLWAGFFTEQAGTPFLWWHEFVHTLGHYHHYAGFSRFMKDVDPRGKNFKASMGSARYADGRVAPNLECRLYGSKSEHYGWVYHTQSMLNYPSSPQGPRYDSLRLSMDRLDAGDYTVQFFNTVTGKVIKTAALRIMNGQGTVFLPRFTIDVAFKIRRDRR